MKKNRTKLYTAATFLLLYVSAYAQEGRVGINTTTPAATLDVVASPSVSTRIDGFIAPRLEGNELKSKDALYTSDQTGTVIYAKSAATPTTTKTINVTMAGYYYFDGSIWQKVASGTVDKTDDEWINNTTQGAVILGKTSSGTDRVKGAEIVATDDGRIGIGTSAPAVRLDIPSGQARVGIGSGFQTRIGNGYIDFYDSTGTLKANVASNNTAGDLLLNSFTFSSNTILNGSSGNVGIGVNTPSQKLHIQTSGTSTAPVKGFRLVDGNQSTGRVLTSDANGVGTWESFNLFVGGPSNINGTFTWTYGTNLGNSNWNSIASIDLQPNTTYMVYAKLHFINTHVGLGYAVRTYIGENNLGTNTSNAGGDIPAQGSWAHDPIRGDDFETTKAFVYTTNSSANQKLYFNLQSDDSLIQRSIYTTGSPASYKGVYLEENYFFAVPVK